MSSLEWVRTQHCSHWRLGVDSAMLGFHEGLQMAQTPTRLTKDLKVGLAIYTAPIWLILAYLAFEYAGLAVVLLFPAYVLLRSLARLVDKRRPARPCAVCHEPNRRGHGCHVEHVAVAVSQRRIEPTKSAPFYKSYWGGTVLDRYGPVWACEHKHRHREEAHRCAWKVVRQFQRGKRSLDWLIGPRPKATTTARRVRIADLTPQAWNKMCRDAADRCHYCRGRFPRNELQQEHKVPLSRGGANSISNIVPSCRPCNLQKGSMTDVEYMIHRRKITDRASARRTAAVQSTRGLLRRLPWR